MYLVLSGTFKKIQIRQSISLMLLSCFHLSNLQTPISFPSVFRSQCCPRPPFLSIALPRGELHKDLQHDSFLNLLPTVPNQPLIMRHVQQENNLAHSLSDWQTHPSLPTHWCVNQPVSFEMLLGFFTALHLYRTITKYHYLVRILLTSHHGSFWELDLSVICQVGFYLCWVQIDYEG